MTLLWFLACTGTKPPDATDGLLHSQLGTFTTDETGAVDVPVEVASGSFSVLLSCGPYGFDLMGHVGSIVDPGGATIYDGSQPQTGYLRVPAAPDQLTVLLPTSPGLPVSAGIWTVRVVMERPEATTISCETVQRNGTLPRTPALELHFVFVGTDVDIAGLNATGALSNASFAAMVNEITTLWSPIFDVDPVSTEDFSGDPSRYAAVGDAETVGELLRNSQDARWLSVFVVPHLSLDGTDIPLARLPSIGTAAIGGTSRSGLVLSTQTLATDPPGLGQALAAAGAQFMGLFPVVSVDGVEADPLDDTPRCVDGDGDGALTTAECAGQGAENLLWPSGGPQATALSSDQGWVLERSLLLQ